MSNFSSTYPSVSPTYQIDFANGKRIPPNATFSRADSPIDATKAAASAVHFWSNEKHLSSENLLTPSTPDSSWVRARLTPTYSQTGPYTGANATLHTEQAVTNTAYLGSQNYTTVANTSYTYSVWVKQNTGSRNYYQLRVGGLGTGVPFVTYHLSGAGSIDEFGGSYLDSYSITAGPTGWYKLTMTITPTSAATTTYFFLCVAAPSGGEIPSITGDTGNSFLVFGAQVSSTGETVLNETSGQIHREYAPTLKSVATAGAARFEYDPTDGQSAGTSLGILVESQSTNLLANSAAANTLTGSNNVVETDAAVAPDGTLTADKMRVDENGTPAGSYRYATWSVTSGQKYTISYYVKAAGLSHIAINFRTDNSAFANGIAHYNLNTGAVDTNSGLDSYGIDSCGNGWYRCWASATATATTTATYILFLSDGDTTVVRDGYSGVLLWGGQVENNSFPSSYIATSGATATRAADSLSVTDASIFNGGEHSVYWEGSFNGSIIDPRMFAMSDGTSDNRFVVDFDDGNVPRIRNWVNGTSYMNRYATGQTLPDGFSKIVGTLKTDESRLAINGTQYAVDTTNIVVGTMDRLGIGTGYNNNNIADGHVKRVAYYNTALSQTEIETLTAS